MTANIIDGAELARGIQSDTRRQVEEFRAAGVPVKLTAVLVGQPAASLVYARSQERQCKSLGIDYELAQLPIECDAHCVLEKIDQLNQDASVTGIMLHMPLPPWIDAPTMQYQIDPYKDVEGVNPANIGLVFYGQPIIAPCTALAVVEIVRWTGINLRGANAVVVGQGPIVGRPVSVFLIQQDATVTACNEFTPDLASRTREADLLIVAAGKAGLVGREHVKPGAIVIDVGINRVSSVDETGKKVSKTVGDVVFDEVRELASALTPVPGGVGPVTVSMLLRNTVEAARKQQERR